MAKMRANVFRGKNDFRVEEVERPSAGLGDHRIVSTLCPGGKERMRRLMEVVRRGRVDLTPLLTHTFSLDKIGEAYDLFGERMDGVLKVAIKP
jgi:threonine dehydrogenase-like Zn-dependent dehydrogenase